MTLWWIANIVLVVAVFPVVLMLLNGVLAPIERIRMTVDEILDNAVVLSDQLDSVPQLLSETDATVAEVAVGATRYERSLERLLELRG